MQATWLFCGGVNGDWCFSDPLHLVAWVAGLGFGDEAEQFHAVCSFSVSSLTLPTPSSPILFVCCHPPPPIPHPIPHPVNVYKYTYICSVSLLSHSLLLLMLSLSFLCFSLLSFLSLSPPPTPTPPPPLSSQSVKSGVRFERSEWQLLLVELSQIEKLFPGWGVEPGLNMWLQDLVDPVFMSALPFCVRCLSLLMCFMLPFASGRWMTMP